MTGENGSMYMPVAPAGYGGDGMFGGNGAWWIIILLAVLGWGNGFGGWGGNGYGNGMGAEVQRGFDQSAVTTGINGLTNAVQNGFAQAEISANARQMADMNQVFALQTSMQNCCCENRAATADLKYTIANEAAATRAASSADRQMIMDKLCQLEMDGIKQNYEGQLRAMQAQINAVVAENQSLKSAASHDARTAQILANNEAQTIALERYLAPQPVPAYVVQNPNCCQQNYSTCGGYAA